MGHALADLYPRAADVATRSPTELITPRDLVTHRSGLPRHDLLPGTTPALTGKDDLREAGHTSSPPSHFAASSNITTSCSCSPATWSRA